MKAPTRDMQMTLDAGSRFLGQCSHDWQMLETNPTILI